MINNIHYEEALNNILIVVIAAAVVLVLVMLFRPGGIFGRWEFSLTRALEKLTGRGTVKAKAEKGA